MSVTVPQELILIFAAM